MTPAERYRRAARYSKRVRRAQVMDPIENLRRLIHVAAEYVEKAKEASYQMQPWLETLNGIEFQGEDANVVESARRLVVTATREAA